MARGAIGREIVMAFDKTGTWGTAASLGASDGFYALSSGITRAVDQHPDDSAGMAWLNDVTEGNEVVTGGPPQYLRYHSAPQLMMATLAMGGYANTDAYQSSSGDKHALTLATSNNTLFGTLAWNMTVEGSSDTYTVDTYKPMGFTIEGSMGGLIMFTPIGIGSNITRGGAGLGSVTVVSGSTERIPFSKLTFYVDDAEAGTYSTQIYPSGFTFTFNRNANPEHVAHGNTESMEPEGEGYPTITLSLNFPQYGHHGLGERFVDDWYSGQAQEIKINYTGASLGGTPTTYETWELYCDNMHIVDDVNDFSGPGRVPETVNFTVLDPSDAALPFFINVISDVITAALY